ncbi:MAG: hypothetical protein ACYSWO_03065 [Planctomycetota bacterium]
MLAKNKLPGHLKKHWPKIREQLLVGAYSPKPVRRVEIPKSDGGIRKLTCYRRAVTIEQMIANTDSGWTHTLDLRLPRAKEPQINVTRNLTYLSFVGSSLR